MLDKQYFGLPEISKDVIFGQIEQLKKKIITITKAKYARYQFSKVVIYTNFNCNLRCKYCVAHSQFRTKDGDYNIEDIKKRYFVLNVT